MQLTCNCGSRLLLPGQVRRLRGQSSCSQPGTISPRSGALSCTVPRLSGSLPGCCSACASVLGSSRTDRVCGHKMVFKGGTLGAVFAVSVGDVRTTRPGFLRPRGYKEPGGGRHAPEQQIPKRTEGGKHPHTRACTARRARLPVQLLQNASRFDTNLAINHNNF